MTLISVIGISVIGINVPFVDATFVDVKGSMHKWRPWVDLHLIRGAIAMNAGHQYACQRSPD